ncbi:hypothetical protein Adt_31701 [Abeliophyllum distichum]|uniref:Uncharacterized protein n=1 Tax=Abeliophyllum distichum TaxID=126358 RepID=A0ABD1REV0_9LAMI
MATRKEPVESWQVHGHQQKAPLISFIEENEVGIRYPHCDALVVRAIVARNGLGRMLVDDGSADHPNDRFRRTPAPPQKIHGISDSGYPLRLPQSPRKARVEGFTGGHVHTSPGDEVPYAKRVAKVCGNQTEARVCYMNALRKVAKREDAAPAVMTIHSEPMDLDHIEPDEEMILDEGLDLQIIGSDSLVSPAEELKAFPVNPSEPT